jgi:hypothetical protein
MLAACIKLDSVLQCTPGGKTVEAVVGKLWKKAYTVEFTLRTDEREIIDRSLLRGWS